ncbi:MAG: DUF4365 domain-containing protein [Verrucomicrobiota bacterium]
MPKTITDSQLIGERGETATKLRFLEIDFQFDVRGRLEVGIDAIAEVMLRGKPLAQMIAVQVKTTDKGRYSNETDSGFTYSLRLADLEYWRQSNLPIIIVLHRLSDQSFYWKPVNLKSGEAIQKLQIDKTADSLDTSATDKLAALCVEKSGQGYFVPPLRDGETAVINMVPVTVPDEIFVATTPYETRQAMAILLKDRDTARFDWVIHKGTFWSFHDPRQHVTASLVDEDQVDAVDTSLITEDPDEDQRNRFAFLLKLCLGEQFRDRLEWRRDKKLYAIRAKAPNTPLKFHYQSTVKKTSADVVNVVMRTDEDDTDHVNYVRHHAFIPRFEWIDDLWYLFITPTYYFTYDGFRPHSYPDALLSGKKRLESNASLRGQIILWHAYLSQDQIDEGDMFAALDNDPQWPVYGELPVIELPQTVPEDAWPKLPPAPKSDTNTEARLFDD